MISEWEEKIRQYLFRLQPARFFLCYASSPADVFKNRLLLRDTYWDIEAFSQLASILAVAASRGQPFRRLDCVKVLRSAARCFDKRSLPTSVVSDLFAVYQAMIFNRNQELQWAVSSVLKDCLLGGDQILWFTENWDKSIHLVNRLLRYPVFDEAIAAWAELRLKDRALDERRSEVLSRRINGELPRGWHHEKGGVVPWAIYYSSIDDAQKKSLLIKAITRANEDAVLDVCSRLRMAGPIEKLARTFRADQPRSPEGRLPDA